MNATTEQLINEIYPALFEVLPTALPEFEFIKNGKGYRSNNTRKINGEEGDSRGKVYVYEHSPGYIKDYRIGSMSLWDYIQDREKLTEAKDVVRRLASLAGVSLPEQQFTPEQAEQFAQSRRIADAWEAANDFFIDCLSNKDNEYAKTMIASNVREYLQAPLNKGGRGYTAEFVLLPGQAQDRETPKMELGYMPGLAPLGNYLTSRGFEGKEQDEVLRRIHTAGPSVGTQNILSFPYRDHTGRIRGIAFRTITNTNDYKYLYSEFDKGERAGILFNLKAVSRDKDLTIVEAPLDSLHAAALGIKNIVALGGSGGNLNKTQVDLAIRYGAERITLMFDNDSQDGVDRAGAIGTDKAIAFLQKDYPQIKVFVGVYPDGIKDLDELLASQGKESYYKVKGDALASWEYQLERLFVRYSSEHIKGEYLTSKQQTDLLEEVVSISAGLSSIDKDLFITAFTSDKWATDSGITKQSVTETVDAIRAKKAKEEKNRAAKDLLGEAKKAVDKGSTDEALKALKKGIQEISEKDKTSQFGSLLLPTNEKDLAERLKKKPNDIQTGYVIDGQEINLPAGAITIVAAPTSHGKTTMLINLALRTCERYPNKPVYLLSYEEDSDSVLISAMNTYIATSLSANGRKSIRSYYTKGSHEYINRDARPTFDQKRKQFFDELIHTGRLVIQYVDYNSDSLIDAIHYLHKYGNAGAVIIDYIQLLRKDGWKGSRQEELKEISLDLKDAAVETGLPLILGAQFNREVINAARMHPTKIGESGDIERAANLILGFWNNNFKPLSGSEKELEALNKLDHRPDALYVEILKYRGDRVGGAGMLSYDGNTGVIENYQQTSLANTFSSTSTHSSII